ncbi:MAG: DMT family transporter [Hyphomicrobiaceae bacterium]
MPHFTPRKLLPFAGRMIASGTPGRRNDPIAGLIWVTLSMALLAGLGMFGKYASQAGLHPFQVVFFRNLFCVVLMLPLLAWRGRSLIRTDQLHLYGLRVTLSMIGMNSWFLALAMIPLTEITAISFLAPLFGTLCAVLFLGEVVRGRRWTALIVGFLGAMVILRPGSGTVDTGHMLALLSACIMGIVGPLVKQLTATDDADRIVFLTNLIMTPLSLVPALFVWVSPPLSLWPVLIGMGACAVLGHITLVRGFSSTDASLVFTFEFSRLPFAALIGWLVFAEQTDLMTWVGALIIFGSALYITQREAQIRKGAAQVSASKAGNPLAMTPLNRE